MKSTQSLVLKIQNGCLTGSTQVTELLRLAKVLAAKLELTDPNPWIERELNGYHGLPFEEIPEYRVLSGAPKAWNPYRGWRRIQFQTAASEDKFSTAPINQSLPTIESLVADADGNWFQFPYPAETKKYIQRAIDDDTEVTIFLEKAPIINMVEQVRNLLLDWTLSLEKAGIIGADLQFSSEEIEKAHTITHNFFVENANMVGFVGGSSKVSNSMVFGGVIQRENLEEFLTQTQAIIASLPSNERKALAPVLEGLQAELDQEAPSQEKLRDLLGTIKSICEGASGNVAAQGILALIGSLFG